MRVFLLFILFFAKCIGTNGQALSYTDMQNLQKASLDKAKGFFNYAGFTWSSSEKGKNALNYSNYPLTFDVVKWKRGSDEVQLLMQAGYENVVIYRTDNYSFSLLEEGVKAKISQVTSATQENTLSTTYNSANQRFVFNTKKVSSWGSSSNVYEVIADNPADINRRVGKICSNCMGKGTINQTPKCSKCNGMGRGGCYSCSGTGKKSCSSCTQGKVTCSKCFGKGENSCSKCFGAGSGSCNKCFGAGEYSCNKCFGAGEYNCDKCYGSGKVNQNIYVGTIQVPCMTCGGDGKHTCANCSGKGKHTCTICKGASQITCTQCAGAGKFSCNQCGGTGGTTCKHCMGSYNGSCGSCSGTGFSSSACSWCNGSGYGSGQVQRTCTSCNGSGTK